MNTLTSLQISYFLDEIKKKRSKISDIEPINTIQSLERFENQLTLDELESCIMKSQPHELSLNITTILSSRWERIRGSNLCYTNQPTNLVNQLCLALAKAIATKADTAQDIDALEPNDGPYCLLMPSLEQTEDIYGENIHHFHLHEFILSDKERVFIPLAKCLHQASVSEEGQLRHVVMIDNQYPLLNTAEILLVSTHSVNANRLFQAVIALNNQRLIGDDIGAKLSQLARALRNGGVHQLGEEYNAGLDANVGISGFYEYWESLSDLQKSTLYQETDNLESTLGRLFRPNDEDYTDSTYCVELIADDLDPIIESYNKKPLIKDLKNAVLAEEKAFQTATQRPRGVKIIPKEKPPKHILHHLFKLCQSEQHAILRHTNCKDALTYALTYEPGALPEFELDEESKSKAILMTPNDYKQDTALIVAAKHGQTKAMSLLLNWGANIEATDINGANALHWAAENGHVDAIECLLDYHADIDMTDDKSNTALMRAVKSSQDAAVELLLKRNANIYRRNLRGFDALNIARKSSPSLIKPILLHIVSLPLDEQHLSRNDKNCVLFTAKAHPELFDEIIDKVFQQPNRSLKHALLTTENESGYSPLILAAQLGAHQSISKLAAYGIDIESRDPGAQCTALHWAAKNGHTRAIECLLEQGAAIDSTNDQYRTPLHIAVVEGNYAATVVLLNKRADVCARDQGGENVLETARISQPKLIEPILSHLVTCPLAQQTECLKNLSYGAYQNVLFYAALEKPGLFDELFALHFSTCPIEEKDILEQIQYASHLKAFVKHYHVLKNKSALNSNYLEARVAARALIKNIIEAQMTFIHGEDSIDKKILTLQTVSKKAIDRSKPALQKHQEWGKLLAKFLLAILTLPISLPLYALGFFSISLKSESAQLIDNWQEAIERPYTQQTN